jgi:hypothetical protein
MSHVLSSTWSSQKACRVEEPSVQEHLGMALDLQVDSNKIDVLMFPDEKDGYCFSNDYSFADVGPSGSIESCEMGSLAN